MTVAQQLQYVSWQLDRALGNLDYYDFNVSSEVVEQVRNNLSLRSRLNFSDTCSIFLQVELVRAQLTRVSERAEPHALETFSQINPISHQSDPLKDFVDPVNGSEEGKKPPRDFLCPISLDLMKDPVVISTGQV